MSFENFVLNIHIFIFGAQPLATQGILEKGLPHKLSVVIWFYRTVIKVMSTDLLLDFFRNSKRMMHLWKSGVRSC